MAIKSKGDIVQLAMSKTKNIKSPKYQANSYFKGCGTKCDQGANKVQKPETLCHLTKGLVTMWTHTSQNKPRNTELLAACIAAEVFGGEPNAVSRFINRCLSPVSVRKVFVVASDLFHPLMCPHPYLLLPREPVIDCRGISGHGVPQEPWLWLMAQHAVEGG